jgi:two-component system alkaline phosphatase synthesis response regulator PhoP/two-component system response regulator VicR
MAEYVLVVDDEKHIRRLIEVNLQRLGYRVGTAGDGVEALEKIQAERPDLVIMDVMMPRMDGFEALRRIKSDPELADLRVLMLTAKAQDADIFRGWSGGVDGYLTKPFNPMDLLAWARRILASKHDEVLCPGRIQL